MSVRGTDFMASYDPLLGESEIVSFSDAVDFRKTISRVGITVKAGQWGGFGGRFGSAIKPPMTLSKEILDSFMGLFPSK